MLYALALLTSLSHASCGAADCPADTMSRHVRGAGWLELGYEFQFVPQNKPMAGESATAVGQVRGHHDEVYTYARVHRGRVLWAPNERWTFGLALPFLSRSHEHIHHHEDGDEAETWSASGVGDAEASVRRRLDAAPAVELLLGIKAPTGPHNRINGGGEPAELALQPGTGSWDVWAGAAVSRKFESFDAFGSATYRWNTPGEGGYRLGDVLQGTLGAGVPVWSGLSILAQANLRVNREDDRGNTSEEVQKTGGTSLYLSPGLEWRQASGLGVYGLISVPVYQRVQGIQIVPRWTAVGGLSYRFLL